MVGWTYVWFGVSPRNISWNCECCTWARINSLRWCSIFTTRYVLYMVQRSRVQTLVESNLWECNLSGLDSIWKIFFVHVWLRQKYYAPKVQPTGIRTRDLQIMDGIYRFHVLKMLVLNTRPSGTTVWEHECIWETARTCSSFLVAQWA